MAAVREGHYILTDVVNNNNKFWSVYEYLGSDGTIEVETHFGRVGESGQRQRKVRPRGFYDQKVAEKVKKGYVAQRTIANAEVTKDVSSHNLEHVASQQIDYNTPETKELIARLVRENKHNILSATTLKYNDSTGLFQTPLGVVDATAIQEARQLLAQIGDLVVAKSWETSTFPNLVNQYMMLIPQNIGRGRPNMKYLWPNLEAVRRQDQILDSLEASLQVVMTKPIDDDTDTPIEQVFDVKLHMVDDAAVIKRIRDKFHKTLSTGHVSRHLDVKRVFTVEISAMAKAFAERTAQMDPANIQELWHGTRVGNLLSILKNGFVIPPANAAHCTGRLFGNGSYFSDQSTKSLNYSYGYWSGTRDENCFMFLCDVAMGKSYTPTGTSHSLPMPGYDSTFAKGHVSGVQNNEMIVYNTNQISPRYLIEFSPSGR